MRPGRAALPLLLALAPAGVTAQSPEAVASVSTDSVALAEAFELRIEVAVPAGSMVFFPDTIAADDDVESAAPVEWRARRGPDDGATLELTYALLPFGMGTIDLPAVDVIVRPLREGDDGEEVPGGSLVGAWIDRQIAIRYTRSVPGPSVWVEPVYTPGDVVAGMSPRGPDDVVGFSWSWPSVALVLLFSSVIVSAGYTTAQEWLAGRGDAPPPPAAPVSMDEARRQAVAALDRLAAAGPYPAEQAQAVYGESSGIVRGYVERLDPAWGPELTSTELMRRLRGRVADGDRLDAEMSTAEAVKFGRLRPGAEPTAEHLAALRAWLDTGRDPGRPVAPRDPEAST